MGKPEGIVEDYLIAQSKKHNCLCYKFVSPGHRGVPDRVVIGHGQTHFIELKSATGKLSEQQKLVIQKMQDHGASVHVLNAKEQIDAFFETVCVAPSKQKLKRSNNKTSSKTATNTTNNITNKKGKHS